MTSVVRVFPFDSRGETCAALLRTAQGILGVLSVGKQAIHPPGTQLQRIQQMESWHGWFQGRRVLLHRLIRQYRLLGTGARWLDIGCGTGQITRMLADWQEWVLGVDLAIETSRYSENTFRFVVGNGLQLPLRTGSVDHVLLLDVLEHVPDVLLLQEVARVLHPDGFLIVTVPAEPWLWSPRDVIAGHLRRYTRKELVRVLALSGFRVLEVGYYNVLLLPALAVLRILGHRIPRFQITLEERVPKPLNSVLTRILTLEARLGRWIPWPMGSSLYAVCRREENP